MTATVNMPCQPISAITDMSRESRCPAAGRVLRGALCHEVRIVQAGLAILQRHPVIHSKDLIHRELAVAADEFLGAIQRSEEHTSELQSLMRISYAVFCLKKKNQETIDHQ